MNPVRSSAGSRSTMGSCRVRARRPLRRVADVEPVGLVGRTARSGMHEADQLQQDEAHDAAVDDRRRDRRRLNPELRRDCRRAAPSAMPFSAFCANTPVSSAPTVPPTPCAATTSSESSSDVFARQMQPEVARNRRDGAERDRAHRADEPGRRRDRHQADDDGRGGADRGRLCRRAHSRAASRRPACPSGARKVVVNASAAIGLAASALPALNPNQPNHSRPAPSSVNGTLCGRSADARIVAALADDDGGHERGDAGVDVHDRAAGEVERAHVGEPAAAPHPVRDRAVDDAAPTAR